jgi:DUF1680 family protein
MRKANRPTRAFFFLLVLSTAALSGSACSRSTAEAEGDYEVQAVPLEQVNVTDEFWSPRMAANRNVSLDYCFRKFENSNAFSVSKLVEAAAYMLAKQRDPDLEAYVDQRVDAMVQSLATRVENPAQAVRVSGHFLEAATAYYEATGKRKILDAALKAADQIDAVYGPGKETHISGHEGLKIGLISLYRSTGDERYWKLAKFFADERGKEDYERRGEYAIDRTYAQDHEPVVQQTEAVGHCVRATFLYIPMTDIGVLAASPEYDHAVDSIWQDAVQHKTYLTGGIGSIRFHEQYGEAYELPNLSAWNETCAAYGNAVWNHRLFLRHKDAQYIDVMERVLYNALLVGVSLKGDRFFYQNPLMSYGDYERFEWINVPCCPPNVVRMIASIGEYIYATNSADDLYVNLFVGSDAEVKLAEGTVKIRQETRYPWDGNVKLHVEPESSSSFTLHVRMPGWARGSVLPGDLYEFVSASSEQPALHVNGETAPLEIERGYAKLERSWRPGDVVELSLPMPVRQVRARPEVKDDLGRVALQRGPLVYCAEWPDNGGRALNLVVPEDARLDSEFRSDLLGGVQVVGGEIQAIERDGRGGALRTVAHRLTAIPYYAWANRGMGEMAVWLAREPAKAWLPPVLPAPVTRLQTSGGVEKAWTGYNDQNDDLGSIYDGREPLNSADQSHRYFRMRPPVGSAAWLQYEFKTPTRISSSKVYWLDDKRFTKLPASWRILYQQNGQWKPVTPREPYKVEKDAFSAAAFEPVETRAVRLEIEPQTVSYRAGEVGPPAAMFIDRDIDWREFGILEWRVE